MISNDYKLVVALLRTNAAYWARDVDGRTVLHSAMGFENKAISELPLSERIAINAKDSSVQNFLHIAVSQNFFCGVALILDYKTSSKI